MAGQGPRRHPALRIPWRKSGGQVAGRLRDQILRAIRPTANHLEGYVPSHAMGRLLEEAA